MLRVVPLDYLGAWLIMRSRSDNYLSGVRTVHLLLGFDLDKLNAFLIIFSLRGMMRLKGHTVKKAESVTPALL